MVSREVNWPHQRMLNHAHAEGWVIISLGRITGQLHDEISNWCGENWGRAAAESLTGKWFLGRDMLHDKAWFWVAIRDKDDVLLWEMVWQGRLY